MRNMGTLDRLFRLMLVIALIWAIDMGVIGGIFAIVLGGAAAILLLTGLFGVCPLYRVLGMSTVRRG